MKTSRWHTLAGTVLLALVALAGNMASASLFFGVDLIFGSIAVLIAAMLLGIIPAAVVAAAGSIYTLALWGHPYAIIIFTMEAVVVAWLYRHKQLNPVVADTLFWLIAGVPLIYVFYDIIMGLPPQAVATILFKQPLNGVFNALIAGTIIVLYRLVRTRKGNLSDQGVKTSEVLFYAFFSLVLLSGAAPVIYEANAQLREEQSRMSQTLGENNRRLIAHLDDRRLGYHRYWTAENQKKLAQTLLAKGDRPILQTGTLKSLSGKGEFHAIDEDFGVWLPPGNMSQMQRWREGRYVHREAVEKRSDINAVVSELPAAPVIDSVQKKYITLFSILTLLLVIGVIASIALSRFLTTPIRALAEASKALDQRITGHEAIDLPSSRTTEFNQLSETLGAMSRRLSLNVSELRRSREVVQKQVEERTHELDETARLLRSVLNAATEFGIIATDPQGRIIVFNSGAEQLLGYRADELHKSTPALFHDPEEIPDTSTGSAVEDATSPFGRIVARAAAHGLDAREWAFLKKNGTRIPVWLTITPIHAETGEITGYLGIAEDITERKRLDRMKNEFISTVSHELRTPLTSIAGSLALITQGRAGDVPEKAHNMANIAYRNTQHLSALVNDLLDMEKLVSGKVSMTLKREDIRPITRETAENHSAFAAQRRVKLETQEPDEPIFASVDRQRLAQALSNLLSNAIKFSPSGGHVMVQCDHDGDGITIRVRDQGAGIPESFHHKIFQRFSQVNTADNRQQPGTGLGLAITQELMAQMGGSVGFESVEGKGSTFWLWVPQQ